MPRTCAGTNRNQLNKTKKREAVEREVRALESAVRAELWPLVFFRISPMAQHEGQRAMAMIHADRFRWEQDVLANPQLTAADFRYRKPFLFSQREHFGQFCYCFYFLFY